MASLTQTKDSTTTLTNQLDKLKVKDGNELESLAAKVGVDGKVHEKAKLSVLDEQRLNMICKTARNFAVENNNEPTLDFLTRLYSDFESQIYNNKSKELYAKALSTYFKQNKSGNQGQVVSKGSMFFY